MSTYNAKVTEIVDGDTMDVEIDLGFGVITRQRLRINNIDTPEVYGMDSAHELHGLKASAQAYKLLEDEEIKIEVEGDGKYGRGLASIILPDERDYAEVMKGLGYAKLEGDEYVIHCNDYPATPDPQIFSTRDLLTHIEWKHVEADIYELYFKLKDRIDSSKVVFKEDLLENNICQLFRADIPCGAVKFWVRAFNDYGDSYWDKVEFGGYL